MHSSRRCSWHQLAGQGQRFQYADVEALHSQMNMAEVATIPTRRKIRRGVTLTISSGSSSCPNQFSSKKKRRTPCPCTERISNMAHFIQNGGDAIGREGGLERQETDAHAISCEPQHSAAARRSMASCLPSGLARHNAPGQ